MTPLGIITVAGLLIYFLGVRGLVVVVAWILAAAVAACLLGPWIGLPLVGCFAVYRFACFMEA